MDFKNVTWISDSLSVSLWSISPGHQVKWAYLENDTAVSTEIILNFDNKMTVKIVFYML